MSIKLTFNSVHQEYLSKVRKPRGERKVITQWEGSLAEAKQHKELCEKLSEHISYLRCRNYADKTQARMEDMFKILCYELNIVNDFIRGGE